MSWHRCAGFLLLSMLGVACRDSSAPTRGTIDVTVRSTGNDLDPDGYVVTLDSRKTQNATLNSTIEFTGVAPGNHSVSLGNLASNCTVSDGNPRSVRLEAQATVTANFPVACVERTGSVRLTINTTGAGTDTDGYRVRIDFRAERAVAANEVLVLTEIHEGVHTLALTDVADNCVLTGGNQRDVSVGYADTTALQFSIACSAPRGTLKITTTTTGLDLDADGYTVSFGSDPWDYGWLYSVKVPANGSVFLPDVDAGWYPLDIDGVATNCRVASIDPPVVLIQNQVVTSVSVNVVCLANGTLQSAAREDRSRQRELARPP